MNVHYASDLKNFTYGNPNIEKHTLGWCFRDPESRAHQIRIQALKNLQMNELHRRYQWSPEALSTWKVNHLSMLTDWAFETTPFYREKFHSVGFKKGDIQSFEDFLCLPSLSREEVVQVFAEGSIVSNYYNTNDCRWFFSSGSSGTPVQIVSPQDRTELDTLHRHRMFEIMANTRFPRSRWIYNINHAHWWHTSFNGDNPVYSITQSCPVEDVLMHLSQIQPIFISCIASYALKLAETGVSLRKLGVEALSTNSETSTIEQRRAMAEIFEVPVCDEYSSEEAGLLAAECRYGRYHCVEDDTHLELKNPDSQGTGEILTTDLWNFAMPILKYEQGDLGRTAGASPCPCGSSFSVIESIQGRIDEAFWTRSGLKVCASEMLQIAENFLSVSGMSEYKVIQRSPSEIEIHFTRDHEGLLLNEKVNQFCQEMENLFNEKICFRLQESQSALNFKNSKRKIFVNSSPNRGG